MSIDPVALTAALIRCPSVTPADGGAIPLLQKTLEHSGFTCNRPDRGGILNLHARFGTSGPVFGFNGHTDVVPTGEGWSDDPFSATLRDGKIWGRGAADMKSGVAAFVAAASDFVLENKVFDGSIVLMITGDEEADATDGTVAILDWMRKAGETVDACLVGEPTCPEKMGDMMKIGRRGSLTIYLTAEGVQGHSAYPHRAKNPLPPLLSLLNKLANWGLDTGTDHFDPSTLAITTVDVGNPATNVIPERATATVNIRFNDTHSGAALIETIRGWMDETAEGTGVTLSMKTKISGESFITEPGPLSDTVAAAVEAETGVKPELSTTGGTSDARFMRAICPVVEFGLVGKTLHKVDEHVEVADIETLTRIYRRILESWFEQQKPA
jgi:succinyl-diaminopimelate desuccinylase